MPEVPFMCGPDTPQGEAAYPMKRFLGLCKFCSGNLSQGAKTNQPIFQPDHIKKSTEPHTRPAFSELLQDRFSSEGREHSVSGGRKPQRHERTGGRCDPSPQSPIIIHPQPELSQTSSATSQKGPDLEGKH